MSDLSIQDQIAEAIRQDLADPANADEFGGVPFAVERVQVLDFDEKTLPTQTKAFVFGADERRTVLSRLGTEREWDVHIGIVRRLKTDQNAEVDPLKKLVERIADFWELRQPTGIDQNQCGWSSMEVVPYIPDLVKELVFLGAIKLTFKGEGACPN